MELKTNNIMYQSMMLNDNQKVNYVTQGEGEPIVLVHGLAASLHDWDDLLPELSDAGYQSFALDLLGHGESEKPADFNQYTFQNIYKNFSDWLDALNITKPFPLIGHSLGGALCLQYAYYHPQKVSSLVLINPFYDVHQLSKTIQMFFRTPLLKTNFLEVTPYRLFRFFVDVSSFNFYIGHRETHILPEHIRYQTALDYTRASTGIYNIPRTLPNLTSNLVMLHQPTLLLYGARDQTLSEKSFLNLGKMIPNIKGIHSFHLCGHVPHQCHPEKLNPHVMEFLKNFGVNQLAD
ncbi:MAG: alpha/beta hydrolase [Anaerolineales bacterium]|nr:alpha/beta hydrolase [Anaerolineales bacterium]MBX3038338.1 alpha/beta hydrolase [Anaerolineales bacterium]